MSLFNGLDDFAGQYRLADVGQQLPEQLAVLGVADGLQGRSEQAHVVLFKDACIGEFHCEVQPCLPAERGQDSVGTLGSDDAREHLDGERLDIDDVGDVLIGHNRCGVGVHQHGDDALFAQCLACLRAGVVELRRLPDDDGAGAYDEDFGWFIS